MKKIIASLLIAGTVLSSASVMALNEVTVNFENEKMEFDVDPFIESGRTLVPMRAIFEKAGASVSWDNDTKTVIAAYNNDKTQKFIVLQINNTAVFVNDSKVELDVPARIVNDRTFVPLRFVMETLDMEVTWDDETKTVNINTLE